MKRKDIVSDEQIGAFIDGELESGEENQMFADTESCTELDARICQHRKLKELVQHAYRDVPEPTRSGDRRQSRRNLLGAAAAVAALFIGFAGGYLATRGGDDTLSMASGSSDAYLLHVASGEPEVMQHALDRAQRLMASSDGAPRQVEIVVNGDGLNLLRSDVTPHAQRIQELAQQDILFYACHNAIERMRERGIEVKLVPEANARYTAVDRVVLRLRDGWTYERIGI